MNNNFSTENSYINSIIGEGTTFKGEINISGLVRIDGDFKGSIDSSGKVLIGRNGRAECNITADTVVIGGAVKGNINAKNRIAVLSSGLVIGNLKAPRLDIEEKVICHGKISIVKEDSEFFQDYTSTNKTNNYQENYNDYNPANKN